jgi:transcriptional regulator with XRE-family HTH domain
MTSKKHTSHLRAYRLRWGLSQQELAFLLGRKSAGAISRLEKKLGQPNIDVVMAIFIIFGTQISDLFPGAFDGIEAAVMVRIWELYEKVQGNSSRRTKAKIELLEEAIQRFQRRRGTNGI